jgi:hypothetical protein
MGRINMFQRTVADQRLVSIDGEQLVLSVGEILRILRLDCFESAFPLAQIAVDHRIIAPGDNVSQTVWWKIIDAQVVQS